MRLLVCLMLSFGLQLGWCTTAAAQATAPDPGAAPEAPERAPIPRQALDQLLLTDVARAGSRLVAVGRRGYAIYSDDDGNTWFRGNTPTDLLLTAVTFADEQNGWAVGHDGVILVSRDSGLTWTEQRSAPEEELPLLDVWFADARKGIAIGGYGLYLETTDGGENWEARSIVEEDRHLNSIASAGGSTLAIAAEAGTLLKSSDGGQTWSTSPSPYVGSYFGMLGVDGQTLLGFGMRGNVFGSGDGGLTWTAPEGETGIKTLLGGAALGDRVVLVGAASALRISDDGGRSFRSLPSPQQVATDYSTALFLSENEVLIVGASGPLRVMLDPGGAP